MMHVRTALTYWGLIFQRTHRTCERCAAVGSHYEWIVIHIN